VSVLLNNADATFAPQQTYAAGSEPRSVTAADLDADGDTDLATANQFSDDVSVLLNQLDPTTTVCPGDTNDDNTVDLTDLLTVLANFGTTTTNGPADGDLDGSGTVDLNDLLQVLANFGNTCP
jgi:hypothetical protein